MKISFDFPIGEVVRIVEAGSSFYGLTGHISSRRSTSTLNYMYHLVNGTYFSIWVEGWKLEKVQ